VNNMIKKEIKKKDKLKREQERENILEWLEMNKKGAVNSYRFIAMYIFIGLIMGMVTLIQQNSDARVGYELDSAKRFQEIANRGEDIAENGNELVQANQFTINKAGVDEASLGRNWIEIISKAIIPSGFIPIGLEVSETENNINNIVVWLRIIIGIFATFEIYQVVRGKTT